MITTWPGCNAKPSLSPNSSPHTAQAGNHRPSRARPSCNAIATSTPFSADADADLMRRAGIRADVLDSGCCGLAGNFGFTAGHYDISQACAERVLFPALRRAEPDTLVLADGFSCRTQISQSDLTTRPIHVAQALHAGLTPP